MDNKQLRELLKLLRSQGVLQYQTAEVNLVLSENFTPPITRRRSEAEELMQDAEESEALPQNDLEEEAVRMGLDPKTLFYSSDKTNPEQ